ncbi:Bug family tripartite tricarboxylate transporter substrate binding protein [Neoroseomonas soli]|uniref:Tripartite tricarboxylate transporter substrate binding protein n=1 Tax=Neoroseomonas soli TaxID=1081025 RepID=A0A9X9WUK8_9PROT|nr:tripartite tricarboxylate transporter substrate binding protein [Neoroseomonas soli]MBR0670837.1 tripartite tricarboxylate transporter substrate binding protein [Neoroseomonas soli]
MISRRHLPLAGLGLSLPFIRPAQAAWPADRPIEVIVPFPPGGGVDAVGRFATHQITPRLPGVRFVVSNRPGASGQLGMEAIFNAAPDGYTIGAIGSLNVSTLPLERPVRWKAEEYTYIANIVDDACGLWVLANSPLRSLGDLVAALKRNPESLSVGSAAGVGSDDHLVLLGLEEKADIRALHAPFNGTAQVQRDLLGGSVNVASFNMSEGIVLMREGKIRCLGQASPARWSAAPDVPTFREQGFDVVIGSARGIVAPPGFPPEAARAMEAAFAATFADPNFVRDAERVSLPLRPLVGREYRDMVLAEGETVRAMFARRPWRR